MLILDIIKKYNLFTKKKFGQNFLVDELLLDKIVACSGLIQNKNILEIGCGPGGLTYSILKQNPKKLISVEIDKDCYNIVKTEFEKYRNFEVINQDAIKINENDLFNGEKIKIIANLPYNVGTTLLIKWLNNLSIFEDFTLLLQKEVVDRIIAKPQTKDYGRLSILVQALCDVKKCFDISPNNFIPAPKVMSSVVYIKSKENIKDIDIKKLSKITLILFNQRRKIIKKPIENLIKNQEIDKKVLDIIDLSKRAEELSVEEFIKIYKLLNN